MTNKKLPQQGTEEFAKEYAQTLQSIKKRIKKAQVNMAQQTFRDPYLFDFLELRENFKEREIEQGLINH